MTLSPPWAGVLKSCLLTKPVPDGGSGRREPTCSQLPSDPGVLFRGEVLCGDSRASGTGSSRSSTCSTWSSQSGWSRSSRRNRPGPMFREWTLLPTLSQMDTTTFRFSLVYTSAVDSVSQLPKYCLWVLGIPNWKAQSGMKTRNECHVSGSTRVLVTPCRTRASLSHRRARSGVLGRAISPLKSLFTVGMRKSISLNWSSLVILRITVTMPSHQSLPVKLNLGQINGTGCLRILAAETVLVCQAWSSKVCVVTCKSLGCTCWRSLNLALHPSWNLARDMM